MLREESDLKPRNLLALGAPKITPASKGVASPTCKTTHLDLFCMYDVHGK